MAGASPLKTHFAKSLLGRNLAAVPIIVLVVTAVAIAIGLGSLALRNADKYAIERQGDVLTRALAAHAEQVGRELIPQIFWQEAAEHVRAHDQAWLQDNYGPYLNDVFGIDQSYVLDSANRPIYAAVDGERVSPDRFAAIEPRLRRWIDEARAHRGGESSTGLIVEPKYFVDGTEIPLVITARIDKIEDRPMVVIVGNITPEDGLSSLGGESPYLLVALANLDDETLARIARNYGFAGLKWGSDTSGGRVAVTLLSDANRKIGTLTFIPDRPTEAFIAQLKPAFAVALENPRTVGRRRDLSRAPLRGRARLGAKTGVGGDPRSAHPVAQPPAVRRRTLARERGASRDRRSAGAALGRPRPLQGAQ